MVGRGVALLVFLSPSLLSCFAERVSINLVDFAGDEEGGAGVDGARAADAGGSLGTMRPDLDRNQVKAQNVVDYVLGEGNYAEGEKWGANKFKGEKTDFYSELLKHTYEDYDYSTAREHHRQHVLSYFTLIIGRVSRQDQNKIRAEKKKIMDGQDEDAKKDVDNVAKNKFSWYVQFQTGLPGALRPSENEAGLAQEWGDLVLINAEDVVTLTVGNEALYKRASEAGLISDDLLEDARQVWPKINEMVRQRHVNALFVSPTLDYDSEVKPFVVSGDYAKVGVAYAEVGCPSAEDTCSFEQKAALTGGGVSADDVFNARLKMIMQAKKVKAEGGVRFALVIVNDAKPNVVALDEQPEDRLEAEAYPLTYKA